MRKLALLFLGLFCIVQNSIAQIPGGVFKSDHLGGGGGGTNILYANQPYYGGVLYDYLNDNEFLISTNGKYKFQNIVNDKTYQWVLINSQTGEVIFATKSYVVEQNYATDVCGRPYLAIMPATNFSAAPCEPPQQGKNCQLYSYEGGGEFRLPAIFNVPILVVHSNGCQDIPHFVAGIPSAFQYLADPNNRNTGYRVPIRKDPFDVSKVLVPTNNEVYVKDKLTGIYSVPIAKQAYALKIMDDGNLVIINKNNKVLWESATGEQQLIDTKINKKFKNIKASFKKGLGLIAQGNVELINTNITQKNTAVVLIANSYLQMLPGDEKSILRVTDPNGSIDLKCMQYMSSGAVSRIGKTGGIKSSFDVAKVEPEEKPVSTFMAYPNPTAGIVNFTIDNIEKKILYVNIMDSSGRNIQRYVDTDKADLSENAAGIYFYKIVTTDGTIFSGKIMKQ